MDFHPHIHFIIPAGGLSSDHTRWIHGRADYFLPVKVLSRVYRGKLLDLLYRSHHRGELQLDGPLRKARSPRGFKRLLASTKASDWVVYTKPPFGGPNQVIRYLARYTHRVAITNNRILACDNDYVTFSYKDYVDGSKRKRLTLSAMEFLRRFSMHILPRQFTRIRHFGFLANAGRRARIQLCQRLTASLIEGPSEQASAESALSNAPENDQLPSTRFELPSDFRCPCCGTAPLTVRAITTRRFVVPSLLRQPTAWNTS
jgi:hypothetical protein